MLALTLAVEDRAEPDRRYAEVSRWSEEAREALPSPAERVLGLIRVYEAVTRLVPLREPVDRLATLYLQRHGLLRTAFGGPGGIGALLTPRRSAELQGLIAARGRTVEDLIALLLGAGRGDEIGQMTGAIGELSARDRELLQAIRDLESERRRADASAVLAATLGREHPGIAVRLCHAGHREYPHDARFSLCLAEIYRHLGDSEGALVFYEITIGNDRSYASFEQALRFVVVELEAQLASEDSRRARETFAAAERILAAFQEHHPTRSPPIRTDQLAYLVGMGEYYAGNIPEAIQRLEASVAARPNRDALLQLGVIAERQRRMPDAIRYYRQALDHQDGGRAENPYGRARVLVHLAEAYQLSGDDTRAGELFSEALEMLRVALSVMPADRSLGIRIERGMVLFHLGRRDDGVEELRQALAAAPPRRAPYGAILSFYVREGRIDEALEVFRLAFNNSDLARMWKIYFSMWIVALGRLQGSEPDATAAHFLQSIEGDDWIDRLGRFFAGDLPYDDLISAAETRGQQAEAYYYQAVLRLSEGDRPGADALLRQVIETNMMGYFEYDFARRLQHDLARPATP